MNMLLVILGRTYVLLTLVLRTAEFSENVLRYSEKTVYISHITTMYI